MKKLLYILIVLFPVVAFTQQPWHKSSPSDYAWKDVGNAGFSAGEADYTSLAFSPFGQPYVAYEDYGYSRKATVMKFDGTNWVNVGDAGFSTGLAIDINLAFSPTNGEPYVAYEDYGDSGKATVMKFDGTNWVNVGNAGFSTGLTQYTSLAFSPSGQPYVAYQDWNSAKATVMKFDGSGWVNVGTAGFSDGFAYYTSLAFSQVDSMPYVAFSIQGSFWPFGPATVMKFDGTNWVYVGNAVISGDYAYNISLAFSPSGQPYVAYIDIDVSNEKAKVMKFDGTNWVNVGNAVSPEALYLSLAFNPSGQPYVAYDDYRYSGKATVMKFDGTNWVNVGNAGFSSDTVAFTSLAFSPSGQPYVAYQDYGNSQKVTVMKHDSVYIGINESKFSLYPNPAAAKITIEIAEAQAPSQLSMINLNGEEVLTRTLIKPKTQIDISTLPGGVYFVRLTNDKTVEVGKFVKQ